MHQLEEIGHYSHQNHHHKDIKKINYPDSIMDTQKTETLVRLNTHTHTHMHEMNNYLEQPRRQRK